jgi:transcriptional regulator with XRE-family HTH domain
MTIAENIKNARRALGMSQNALADAIGSNRVTISRYESGDFLPSVPALERLAIALHTTTAQLSGTVTTEERWDLTERIRNDPDLRILFDQAKNAKPEHIRAAAAMLKSLEGKTDD